MESGFAYLKEKITYNNEKLKVAFSRYQSDDSIAMFLMEKHGQMYTKVTVCIPGTKLDKNNEVIIKTWTENEGLLKVLIDSGIVEDTGKKIPTGYVEATLCRLLKKPEDFKEI